MAATAISRRVRSVLDSLIRDNIEEAFINIVPAIDKTAKRVSGSKCGVGKRVRNFIDKHESVIHKFSNVPLQGRIVFGDKTFASVFYDYIRCTISHEGEVDERLTLSEGGQLAVGEDGKSLVLPKEYILGLLVSVLVEPENVDEYVDGEYEITLNGRQCKVNDLWGNTSFLESL